MARKTRAGYLYGKPVTGRITGVTVKGVRHRRVNTHKTRVKTWKVHKDAEEDRDLGSALDNRIKKVTLNQGQRART